MSSVPLSCSGVSAASLGFRVRSFSLPPWMSVLSFKGRPAGRAGSWDWDFNPSDLPGEGSSPAGGAPRALWVTQGCCFSRKTGSLCGVFLRIHRDTWATSDSTPTCASVGEILCERQAGVRAAGDRAHFCSKVSVTSSLRQICSLSGRETAARRAHPSACGMRAGRRDGQGQGWPQRVPGLPAAHAPKRDRA